MLTKLIARRQQLRNDEGGFTLIELLIVITVLGILAGIVVFGVSTFRQDATDTAKSTNCKMVSTAAEAYNAKTGGYPATVKVLVDNNYLKSAPSTIPDTTAITAAGLATGCTV